MNPFTYMLNELEVDQSTVDHVMAIRYLLPAWAEIWEDNPESYSNPADPVLVKLQALPPSRLRNQMVQFMSDIYSNLARRGFNPSY